MTPISRTRALATLAFALAFILSAFFIFKIPTLDFDEALYRSVVGSMKRANNPWFLQWDTKNLFHKPPVFYWLIYFFSYFIDGATGAVSSIACRMPSFFSTLGILICLKRAGNRFVEGDHEIGRTAIFAFFCGLFPMVTATSVLLDPLQTALLMPALVVPSLLFYDEEKLKKSDWIFWSLSLFASSAVKGLNGIIVPTFAFGVHALMHIRSHGSKYCIHLGLEFLKRVFLPAIILLVLYFYWLNEKIGPAFTHEFIWVQHFERGTNPMEEHSGSFFYQFFVIFLGGGILIPLLAERLGNIKVIFQKLGFPLTFVLSFIVIFGASATKLPHYSWPAWPAICLFIGLVQPSLAKKKYATEIQMLTCISILLCGVFSLSLALFPIPLLGLFAKTPSFLGIMKYLPGFHGYESFAFLIAAFLCFVFLFKKKKILPHLQLCAVFSLAIALCLSIGFRNTIESLMVTPFYQIADSIKKDGATAQDCIRYSGALSPTLSLALAPELLHNRCEPEVMRYLIAPEWKSKECEERNFKVIDQKSYLVLCKKG